MNTLEAIPNAPNTQKMKAKVDNKDITDFKKKLAIQREDIITTANTYAKRLNSNLQEVVKRQMEEFSKLISMTLTGNDDTPELLTLPSTSPNM